MIDITHVHPMLVHFPIVLLIVGLILSTWLLINKQDFAERKPLQMAHLIALLSGLAMAFVAAEFGDIALDAAVAKGFATEPLDAHEELATVTMILFSVLAVALLGAILKNIKITGAKALVFVLVFYIGVGVLLVTAYRGGNLVYKLGVNVELVTPTK